MDGSARGDAVLKAVSVATERFLRGEVSHERIGEGLGALGAAALVDRARVYANVRGPDGRLWMQLRGEHESGGPAPSSDGLGQLYPYHPAFVRWLSLLGEGRAIDGPVSALPGDERAVLEREGVGSIFVVPIFQGEQWWGFVTLEDAEPHRMWASGDSDGLRAFAAALGLALRRDQREQDRAARDGRFQEMVEQAPAVLYIDAPDDSASAVYISPQVEQILGYTPQEWADDPELWPRLLHPDDKARSLAENARHNETGEPFVLEYRMFTKDGRVIWVRDEATLVRDEQGQPHYSIGVMMDITERKEAEEHAAFRAYHDELTELPSRAMLEEFLELSITRARHHDASVAIVSLDLDDFSLVNDSLGHRAGDEILKMVADRLREATRETDLVARRGGDQFLMLLADLERDSGAEVDAAILRAESVVQRVQDSMREPFQVDGTELYVSASLGVSLFPQDADDAVSLQRNAEAAMYDARRAGPGGYAISSRAAFDSGAKLQFVTRLRKAVQAQRWALHYQPVIELATGRMTGVEALIRWIEPDGTMVPPNEFIPLAEEMGLIEQIGDWVVRELVYQVNAWRELDIDLDVGFNLSPRQFWQPDLSSRVLTQFREGHVSPERVLVEITESSAMLDPDRAHEILCELNAAGLRVAIDDFGTGYSSLSRLREMPVSVLKIDRSFVSKVDEDPQAKSIVTAFLELGGGLGMTTLAEGIETEGELAFLRERGCLLGQGFLFSRPVPPEEIISFALGGVPAADLASA